MADDVFAGVGSDKAYVFRRSFADKKWENVAKDNKTSKVHFLKRSGNYFFKVSPEDGITPRFERALARDNDVHNSGGGFLQVPLTDLKELYGIKFKHAHESEAFYRKILNKMGIPEKMGPPTIQPTPVAVPPYSDQTLPAPIISDTPQPFTFAATTVSARPPPMADPGPPHWAQEPPRARMPPPQLLPQPQPQPQPQPPQYPPPSQVPLEPQPPRLNQQPHQFDQPDWSHQPQQPGPRGYLYQQDPTPRQAPPVYPPYNQQQLPYQQPTPLSASTAMEPVPRYPPHQAGFPPEATQPPPLMPQKPKLKPVSPPQRRYPSQPPQPPQPSQPSQPSDIHSMASFLTNAINSGNIQAAKGMIDILASLPPGRRKFTVTYDESLEPVKEEPEFVLDVQIEFQQANKTPLSVFVNVKESFTLLVLQQMVENNFHIPRATQNWIIGPKLVKNATDLQRTLKDYEITATAGKAKVYLYVMHVKKANVPKEEYDYIRQRQKDIMSQQQMQPPAPMGQQDMGQWPGHMEVPMPMHQSQPPEDQQIYSRLNTRGYELHRHQHGQFAPQQPPSSGHQPYYRQPQQYAGQPSNYDDPVYSQLDPRVPGPVARDSTMRGAEPPQDRAPPIRARGPEQNPQLAQQMFVAYPNQFQGPPQGHPVASPPQPPPPKEEKKVGWVCVGCTFINKPRRPGCEQCGTARPEDYKIPDNCPLDDDELRIMQQEEENEKLFQQYAKEEKERRRLEAQENYQALMQAEEANFVTNDDEFDCPVCFTGIPAGEGVRLRGCLHQFCKDCLHGSITNSQEVEVKCPFMNDDYQCDAIISEREIRGIVTPKELEDLYRRGLRQAENAAANSFHCRTANCEGFCFYEDEVNEFDCPLCAKRNCLLCKAIHEGMNCQEYQDDLKRRAENDAAAKATQDMLEQLVQNEEAMYCPQCKIIVQKKDGCDWIRCSMCKTEICWATKGPRWGPKGRGDTSGGCRCRVGGKKCTPVCRNCH